MILALQRATHVSLQWLAAELADLDLTPSEINALGNLADGAARTVSELGTAIGGRPTTLTGILDRLERRGLVTRGPRPGDRRAVEISLTAHGRHAAARVQATLDDLETTRLAGLDGQTIAGFHAVTAALTVGLSQ